MRQLKSILYAILALWALTLSCVEPLEPAPSGANRFPANALIISPRVLGVPATKATIAGEDVRGENKLATIDVFVYRKAQGTTYFFHRYSLTAEEGASFLSGGDILLESDWRTPKYPDAQGAGYEGNTFKIYVLANLGVNVREADIPESPTEAQLRALVSTSKQTISGSYDVVRLVDGRGPGENDWYNPHIADNLFLMDGVIDDWTPDTDASQQYFTVESDKGFNLARAAAKFKVTLRFSEAFLEGLGTADADKLNFTKVTDTWTEGGNKKTEVVTTIGNIQAKFANFMPATHDFDPSGYVNAADLAAFRDANLWESAYRYDFSYRTPSATSSTGYKYPYIDTTYSYAFAWDADEAAEKAPALAASIIYTRTTNHYDSDGMLTGSDVETETDYYRIPLVDVIGIDSTPVTSIKRNFFYQVEATINSMGATTVVIDPTKVELDYKVIPWTFNEATDVTEVEGAELLYFTADTTYILRGENTQSTKLDYFTPKSEMSGGHYLYEPVLSNVHVYYMPDENTTTNINAVGTGTYSNADRHWAGTDVTLNVVPDASGGGYVQISSTVLANRAVKYIEFDASVTFNVPNLNAQGYPDGNYTTTTVTHHYLIKHFPLDNIQSIMGHWSSRWDGITTSGTTYYRKRFYIDSGESTVTEITQSVWAAGIGTSNEDRKNANSQANAINGYYAMGGSQTSDTYTSEIKTVTGYTWNGTTVTMSGTYGPQNNSTRTWTYSPYDYVVSTSVSGSNQSARATTVLWKYEKYYRYDDSREYTYTPDPNVTYDGWEWVPCTQEEYNATSDGNRKLETVEEPPSTGTWVTYGGADGYNQGTTYENSSTYTGTQNTAGYYAKVWDESVSTTRIYRITGAGQTGQQANVTVDATTQKNNPHMYIIQISKAETDVVLGRPVINTSYQSNDNVVSPAFMIASQLGAVTSASYTAATAAEHCHTYMEVSSNGRRFVHWRLPTKSEIAYIASYQNDTDISGAGVFQNVLTGKYYYTLDGGNAPSEYSSADDENTYVRCIRDLTPEEVAELNSTGTITAATY